MSTIDYTLIGIALLSQVILWVAVATIRVARPNRNNSYKTGKSPLEAQEDHENWLRKAQKAEKIFNPTILLTITGTALFGWMLYRTILSFM